MDLNPRTIALSFFVVAITGALVGLEREPGEGKPGRNFAGIRTYPIIALLGALCGMLALQWGGMVVLGGLAVVTVLLAVSFVHDRAPLEAIPKPGLTSEVAALVVFVLGAVPFAEGIGLAHEGRLLLTIALGATLTGLLSLRTTLHRFARAVDTADLHATVQFVLLASVALPLVPDIDLGPYDALNPHGITLVIALVAGISFLGYAAVRVLGARQGIGLVGLFGGLVSSTAVTLTFSGRGRDNPRLAPACAMAIVLASTVMFPRVLVLIWALDAALVPHIAVPFVAMLAVGAVGTGLLWLRQKGSPTDEGEPVAFSNPFQLSEAFKVGLVFAVVLVVAAWAQRELGDAGVYLSAATAGLTDVDPVVLSMARLHADGALDTTTTVRAITLAALVNTMVKGGMALVLGRRVVGAPVAGTLAVAAVVGIGVAIATT
jgi:uncharacterized membrane protein (DUF4010 family)